MDTNYPLHVRYDRTIYVPLCRITADDATLKYLLQNIKIKILRWVDDAI